MYRHIPFRGSEYMLKGDVPGPPLQWDEPEDISNPEAGYGFVSELLVQVFYMKEFRFFLVYYW